MANMQDSKENLRVLVRRTSGKDLEAYALHVSKENMCLLIEQHLPKGEMVGLDVYLSLDTPLPIRVMGESLWSRQIGNKPILVNLDLGRSRARSLDALIRQTKPQSNSSKTRKLGLRCVNR